MDEQTTRYLIRDDERMVRPLDLLQAWGPPVHPPVRIRIGRAMVKFGAWLQGRAAAYRHPECMASCCRQ